PAKTLCSAAKSAASEETWVGPSPPALQHAPASVLLKTPPPGACIDRHRRCQVGGEGADRTPFWTPADQDVCAGTVRHREAKGSSRQAKQFDFARPTLMPLPAYRRSHGQSGARDRVEQRGGASPAPPSSR